MELRAAEPDVAVEELSIAVRDALVFREGCVVDFTGARVLGLPAAEKKDLLTVEGEGGVRRLIAAENFAFVTSSSVLFLPPAASCTSGSECLVKLAPEPGLTVLVRPSEGDFIEGAPLPVCLTRPGEILNLRTEGSNHWLIVGFGAPEFSRVWLFCASARSVATLKKFVAYCEQNGWEAEAVSCDTRRMVYSSKLRGRGATHADALCALGKLHDVQVSMGDFKAGEISYSSEE